MSVWGERGNKFVGLVAGLCTVGMLAGCSTAAQADEGQGPTGLDLEAARLADGEMVARLRSAAETIPSGETQERLQAGEKWLTDPFTRHKDVLGREGIWYLFGKTPTRLRVVMILRPDGPLSSDGTITGSGKACREYEMSPDVTSWAIDCPADTPIGPWEPDPEVPAPDWMHE